MPPTAHPSALPLARPHRRYLMTFIAALVIVLVAAYALVVAGQAGAASSLISQGRPATASSTENATFPASAAVDGNTATRWSSAFADPQWLQVDLGATATITQVVLNWEAAYASSFQIQVSANGTVLDHDLQHDHRYRRRPDAQRERLRPVRADERHRAGHRRTATRSGSSRSTARSATTSTCGTANAAQGRPATASSTENATFPASAAVDGNTGTRWSSAFADPQWLQVDLGSSATVCQVILNWEAAYGRSFQIQVSADAANWTTIFSTTTGTGGVQTLNVNGTGRYVRMYGTVRGHRVRLLAVGVRRARRRHGHPAVDPAVARPPTSPPPGDFWGDTSTIPAAQNVLMLKILNRTNGHYPDSQVYWSFNGVAHSIADQPYFDMPANSAGRMYFYLGSPNSQYFDFIEFTVGASVFNGNTTRVDAFGLKLAMRLHAKDGYDVQVGEDQATFAEDRTATFHKFISAVPNEFKVLAQTQAPYRIIAPGSDPSFRAGGVNANYFTGYASANGINAPTSDIFGCAGVAGQRPRALRRAQPARRPPAPVAVVDAEPVLPGRAGQLLRQVLARPRDQQPGVRLPVRRLRRTVVVHLPRQPAVPAHRGRLVATQDAQRRPVKPGRRWRTSVIRSCAR